MVKEMHSNLKGELLNDIKIIKLSMSSSEYSSSTFESVQLDRDDETTMSEASPPAEPIVTHAIIPSVDRSNQSQFLNDVTRSVPANEIHECYLRREKRGVFGRYIYLFYGEKGDPIFTAKIKNSVCFTKYIIYEPISGGMLGTVLSDTKRLNYSVTGPNNLSANIEFKQNFLGRNGCRFFTVSLFTDNIIKKFVSKPPVIIDGNFYYDFHNMESVPSIKNFICVEENNMGKEVCLFTRTSDQHLFLLRIRDPFTMYFGFALSLTSMYSGLYNI